MPYPELKAILTDIGTEESAPLKYQLTFRIYTDAKQQKSQRVLSSLT